MQTKTTVTGRKARLALSGKLGLKGADELDAAIAALPDATHDIDLDLSGINYLSSAGLAALMRTNQRCEGRDGRLRLLHPSSEVMEVLDMTSLTTLFTIVE